MQMMRKRNWILFVVFAAVLVIKTFPLATVSAADKINWEGYPRGMSIASENKKPVFLHFYATWCSFCRKMDKESFQDTSIASRLNESFIPIRVDIEIQPEIAKKYGVFALPTTYFFDSKGQKLGQIPGYIDKDRLLSILEKV